MAVFAPMPSASVSTAMAVKPGLFRNMRSVWRTSCSTERIESLPASSLFDCDDHQGSVIFEMVSAMSCDRGEQVALQTVCGPLGGGADRRRDALVAKLFFRV